MQEIPERQTDQRSANPVNREYPGTLYIVSAASGTGKTRLVQALVGSEESVVASVSHTTRPKRSEELEGVHYHFVDAIRFRSMADEDAFLEHALVFGNFYGTSREWVLKRLRAGTDVVLEIDWQGARQVREKLKKSVGIFIVPPSLDALEERLRTRGQDTDAVIARRTRAAAGEISHFGEFEYLVINDDFHRALEDLRCIVRAGRLRRENQVSRHPGLISSLVESPS